MHSPKGYIVRWRACNRHRTPQCDRFWALAYTSLSFLLNNTHVQTTDVSLKLEAAVSEKNMIAGQLDQSKMSIAELERVNKGLRDEVKKNHLNSHLNH